MELYAAVRRSVYVEGLSERAAARRFGLARETVRKMLRYRRPPGYRRAQPVRRPKLDAFTGIIDQILREDQSRPKKQRHTAKRIGERLRAEYGFTGGDTIVKAYVRAQRLGGQEMFVPLAHPPGDAQADFAEALVVIAGVECKAHDLVVDLPHSDDGFVQAFPAETTEAFCDGRVRTADRRAARSTDPPRPHPGAERRELSPRTQQESPPARSHPGVLTSPPHCRVPPLHPTA